MTELIKQKKQVPERLYSNKKLAALLIPLALDQLLNSFMGTIDTLVVSNLGSAAISAVSLVDSINILIVQAFFALASGGTVVCSHYLGCKSKDHAKEAARQLVFVTLMLSLIIGVICLVFNQQILNLIFGKVEKDVMAGAKQYFFYSVLSYPFIALYNDGACILRAQNNSKFPMQISIVSNFLNAFLDVIFVWVFHWGVAGSAIATAGSRFFSMSIVLWKLRNPSLEIPFRNYFSIRPNCSTGNDECYRELKWYSRYRYRYWIDDRCRRNIRSGKKGRSRLLYKETLYYCRNNSGGILSDFLSSGTANYLLWRNGTGKRKVMHLHGNVD